MSPPGKVGVAGSHMGRQGAWAPTGQQAPRLMGGASQEKPPHKCHHLFLAK